MPELSFQIQGAEPVLYAVAPLLALKLSIANKDPEERIQSILLQCQIRIEATRRNYGTSEQARLFDLFGEPERWAQTLRTTLWTHVNVNVRPFSGTVTVEAPVPCTFDFNVAVTKYLHALESGEVPLCVLFSGTVFYEDPGRGLQVAQIPWENEARYRLPIGIWKQLMDLYYPNTAWLTLRRDVFNRLYEYKMRHGIPTWDQALDRMLDEVNEGVPS